MTESASYLNSLRESQLEIIRDYVGGRMGVSAVPGSGKTFTLSVLAADIILSQDLNLDQEVLIVTMTTSAVKNFAERIGAILNKEGLMPHMGYRVRTLHGLAHDIVRERPGLVNLASDFAIVDERDAAAIREGAVLAWLRAHPTALDDYLNPDLNDSQRDHIREKYLPSLANSMALAMIRYAKDHELTPEALRKQLESVPMPLPLAVMGCDIYQEYQHSLAYRGAVDFDDLIRLALAALRADPNLTRRLRQQWPFILEDEAQDSSHLQQCILELLVGEGGNWVRVGDPNQAIYETFTTADPRFLMEFIHAPQTVYKTLPVSGRSTASIIALANHLIEWTRQAHPLPEARDALYPPLIRPTGPDDPQPNPPDDPRKIHLSTARQTPEQEMETVVKNLERWHAAQQELPEEQRETLVVLDLRNDRGAALAELLRKRNLEPVELLDTTAPTRQSAGALTHILRCLADPKSVTLLTRAFKVWRKRGRRPEGEDENSASVTQRAIEQLKSLKKVEDYLYPLAGEDWLEKSGLMDSDPQVFGLLLDFKAVMRRWHGAALLPVDQVVLTVSQDLFYEPADLAIAYKLALTLRQTADNHPDWRLPDWSGELEAIARNQRRFLGFSDDDSGFNPENYRGRVVITTMHKAKGLEWDRVYLLSVNNFNFPSGDPEDAYYGEKWYIRERLNLEAEGLEQMRMALSRDEYEWYEEGRATREDRAACIRERLRLLYVGITRAKRALIVTWNTGKNGRMKPALALDELQDFWAREIA